MRSTEAVWEVVVGRGGERRRGFEVVEEAVEGDTKKEERESEGGAEERWAR